MADSSLAEQPHGSRCRIPLMTRISRLTALLAGLVAAATDAGPALAQAQDDVALDEVTVTGQAPPGAVLGDIPPEFSLNQRDIRSYGVGTVSELLDELALQTASGQGRGDESPVILVNGRRISGVNEVSDLPTEAILRLDILPEEVALKYGYSAQQKVINIILRRRFSAMTGDATAGSSSDAVGGRAGVDATLTHIRENERSNLAFRAQTQGAITEGERDIVPATPSPGSDPAYRTLQPDRQNYSANLVYATPLSRTVSASTNLTATHTDSTSLNGLSVAPPEPLHQHAQGTTVHLGTTLNADLASHWRLSLTGAYDHASTRTDTERSGIPPGAALAVDQAHNVSDAGDASLLATRKLLRVPAGDVLLSLQGGVHASSSTSESTGTRSSPRRTATRSSGNAQVSVDLPLTRRGGYGGAIGTLTANVNTSATLISDFDTLKTVGYGLNWSPVSAVSLIAAVSEDRRAPSLQQLNGPTLTIANTSIYDYATGRSVLATSTTGGNPLLAADDRQTFKFGATIKPFSGRDFTLTANYVESRIRNAILALPGASPAIEAAFPDRFLRDEDGQLLSLDVRPVNVASQERTSLRWGVSFTQVLREPTRPQFTGRPRFPRPQGLPPPPGDRPPPPQAPAQGTGTMSGGDESRQSVDEVVVSGQRPQGDDGPPFADRGAGRPPGGFGERRGGGFGGDGPPGGGRGFAGPPGGFGRGAGPGGADNGARLQLSVYHTWLIRSDVTLRNGLTPVDLLGGGTLGGPPPSRHQVQFNGGVTDNGIGWRLTGEWRSAGRVVDAASSLGNLNYGALATFNLRLFADLGQRLPKKDWARGVRATLAIQNVFDQQQKITDASGAVPRAYQPGYLDPQGRVLLLSVRKIL